MLHAYHKFWGKLKRLKVTFTCKLKQVTAPDVRNAADGQQALFVTSTYAGQGIRDVNTLKIKFCRCFSRFLELNLDGK